MHFWIMWSQQKKKHLEEKSGKTKVEIKGLEMIR